MLPPCAADSAPPSRASGTTQLVQAQTFETVKGRIVAKLEERMNPAASKRMPSSILRQGLRAYAEQLTELEGSRSPKADRERLVDEVLAELLGYGPLDELFRDPAVREVMVTGPNVVLVRRDTAGWVPTNVRFKDEAHLRAALDRLATHADPVGAVTASVNLFDLKLPNGFRAVAVIPPDAVGQSPRVAFVRVEANPPLLAAEPLKPATSRLLASATTRPLSKSDSAATDAIATGVGIGRDGAGRQRFRRPCQAAERLAHDAPGPAQSARVHAVARSDSGLPQAHHRTALHQAGPARPLRSRSRR